MIFEWWKRRKKGKQFEPLVELDLEQEAAKIAGMSPAGRDRRRADRAPVPMSVDYESSVTSGGAQTVDVSAGGLFLGSRDPLPVGTILRVRFGEASLRVRVARVVEPDAGSPRPPGMGCAILEADPAARKALEAHLAKRNRPRVPVSVDGPWPEPLSGNARAAGETEGARGSEDGARKRRGKKGRKRRHAEPDPEP
jgi:hypothetical protein